MHLAQQSVDVLDLTEHVRGQREVDGIGAQEREVGRVALVPFDAHVGRGRELPGPGELGDRPVDGDHVRALAGERDGVLRRCRCRGRAPACR